MNVTEEIEHLKARKAELEKLQQLQKEVFLLEESISPKVEFYQFVKMVKEIVARQFGIDPMMITIRTRSPSIALPRQIVCYLLRKTGGSTRQIGEILGYRDHSTICYATNAVRDQISTDPKLCAKVKAIEEEIKTRSPHTRDRV